LKNPLNATAAAAAPVRVSLRSRIIANGLRVLALLAVVAITVYIYQIRDHIKDFEAYGYPGIFLVSFLASATVFLPAPGVAFVFAMGSIFHPLLVALAAGTGAALGELSGFLAGFGGQGVVEKTAIYARIQPWIAKYGGWAILVFATIPNPFFDVAGVAAGVTKMPLWRFLLFCWVGKMIKMLAFALAGAYSIAWLAGLIK
jgi:membrane protein YqaA with SNARE-associated domain